MLTLTIISILAFVGLMLLLIAMDFPLPSEIPAIVRVPLMVLATPAFVFIALALFALGWIISTIWPDEPRPTLAELYEVLEDYFAGLRGED